LAVEWNGSELKLARFCRGKSTVGVVLDYAGQVYVPVDMRQLTHIVTLIQ
jgi:hypothetical protein